MLTLGEIKGVGEATLKKLKELDIRSVFELFSFLPSRYIDLSEPISVLEAAPGQLVLLEGRVERISSVSNREKRAFSVTFCDLKSNGKVRFKATFYNLPYMHDSFEVGQKYRLLAKLTNDPGTLNVVNPQMERLDKLAKLSAGIYTQYPLRGVMGQTAFKNIMYAALDGVKGGAYQGSMGKVNADIASAFEAAHRPHSAEKALEALDKLAAIDTAIALSIYKKLSKNTVLPRKVFYKNLNSVILDYIKALPFEVTPSQLSAMTDIKNSLESDECMSRIISGDVGSGKTVVGFFALYAAATSGRQAVLMAPTEVLATQHMRSYVPILERLGVKCALLTSSTPSAAKEEIYRGLASGEISCAIGTQSLISDAVKYKDLCLAVIDEQHKFGVNERKTLEDKGAVDILSMTATPIPRSMALTFYDDIAISYIKKREEATTNVKTSVIEDPEDGVRKIIEALEQGRQAFVVCPSIVDAEGFDISSVESFMRDHGAKLANFGVAALHGKLNNEQKLQAMTDFASGKLGVLVATTVVEVGVDTLASEILILNADRFGLASLHQLRGRVGRDGSEAHCYLQSVSKSENAMKRLDALVKSNDGQYLAELDLQMRGGGDFIGTKQSGVGVTPIFGLRVNSHILGMAKRYSLETLSALSLAELTALTRRGESRVRQFIEGVKKVTLNS